MAYGKPPSQYEREVNRERIILHALLLVVMAIGESTLKYLEAEEKEARKNDPPAETESTTPPPAQQLSIYQRVRRFALGYSCGDIML